MKNLGIFLIWLWIFGACSAPGGSKEEGQTESEPQRVGLSAQQMSNAQIEKGRISRMVMHQELKLNGMVDVPPQNIVSIGFPLGGYLKSTRLLPGMHVNKGSVIAVMEDQGLVQLQQDYLVTRTKLEYLEQEFNRQKTLSENQVNAEKMLQQARADYQGQRIMLKAYSEKLALVGIRAEQLNDQNISKSVPIYSPIDGFVSKVNVNIGKYVLPSDVLFELINPTDIHASLTVFEKDLPMLRIGQKVSVSMVDNPQKEYPAEIFLVSRNVDANRSAVVHCHFLETPKQLLPGMFLNGRVLLTTEDLPALPESALVRYADKEYVFVEKKPGEFEMQEVQTGIREKEWVEIKNGASFEDQTIVTANAYSILGQMKNKMED